MPGLPNVAFAATDSAQIIKGKVPGLLVHNAKLGVMETPLAMLRKHDHTPKDIMFNRLHFPHEGNSAWQGTTAAPNMNNWTLRVDGLVARARTVTLANLKKMGQVKRVSVLQCAGNGRSFYAAKQKVAGGQWKNGGMANVVWEGVPLRHFLDEMKVMPSTDVRWLTAEGWDHPATRLGTDFAKSYRIEDPALDNAIIALTMNGEPIPACHGGPVRLIIPGYYGNMNVKFLNVLMLAAKQSPSGYQSKGYRMPLMPVEPGKFTVRDYTIYNSEPTYGHKIKSVIFSPLPEDKPKAGNVTITGVAFNDGMAPITSVEVSADGGKTWKRASVKTAESPWAWYHWSVRGRLSRGTNVLMSRATDALGRTQPINGLARWNPKGYEWNGVEHLELTV
jgi:DMSO/TMAO reductase YedYZ molybdopterin-dependent catalytic subunit